MQKRFEVEPSILGTRTPVRPTVQGKLLANQAPGGDHERTVSSSSHPPSRESALLETAVVSSRETGGGSDPNPGTTQAEFSPPPELARYVVVEIIGRGGLGLVYAAHDPALERKVAIKLIRPRRQRDRSQATARFLREAQALAKLSHPNVVSVYDVGIYDDDGPSAFVVMEFVAGTTLSAWLTPERDAAEILRTFVLAGRGLAAAHAQALVHRDFKPDNVMVGDDGTVKVLDFGLALIDGQGESSAGLSVDPAADSEPLSPQRLTETGLVMGTPAYMAPEQHLGKGVGPSADQFSFCLALLRALRGGIKIYDAASLRDLADQKSRGRILERPEDDRTPRHVERILRRGLSPRPEDRWPSMDALLSALTAHPRRRWALPLVAGICLAGVGAWAMSRPTTGGCEDGADRLERVWTSTRLDEIKLGLEHADPKLAPEAWSALQTWTAAEVDGWSDAYRATCAKLESGELEASAFDQRMQCLRMMAASREGLVDVLSDPNQRLVERLPDQLSAMRTISECGEDGRLARETTLPARAEDRERVIQLREQLQRARTLSESALLDEARDVVTAAVLEARAIGFEPVIAETAVALGLLELDAGSFEAAVVAFEEAAAAGESSRQDFAATEAAAGATFVLATRLERPQEAKRWLARARSSLERAGRPAELELRVVLGETALLYGAEDYAGVADLLADFLLRFEPHSAKDRLQVTVLLGNLATAQQMLGDYPTAITRLQEALALRIELLGAQHPKIAPLRFNLANTYTKAGRYREAIEAYELAIESVEARLGADHFEVANFYTGRGVALKKLGRYDEARRDYEHALEVMRKSVGVDAPQVAMLLANLGNLAKRTGDPKKALELHQEALAIREKRLGSEHSDTASSLDDIGSLLRAQGRVDDALARHQRALDIRTQALGEEHPSLALSHLLIGNSHLAAGRLDEAARWFQTGQSLRAKAGDHENSAGLLFFAQGRVALARGDASAAKALLGRSLESLTQSGAAPELLGEVRFELARARWSAGDKALARDALAQARVELRSGGAATEDRLAELEAWALSVR